VDFVLLSWISSISIFSHVGFVFSWTSIISRTRHSGGINMNGTGVQPVSLNTANHHRKPVLPYGTTTHHQTSLSYHTDPRDALYQLKYWPTVVRITQTDRVLACGALSATAMFYSATCIVLYMHHSHVTMNISLSGVIYNACTSTLLYQSGHEL